MTLLITFAALLLSTTPVAVALGLTSLLAIVLFTDVPVFVLSNGLFHAVNSYTLLAVPFFYFAGKVMTEGRSAAQLAEFAQALTARLPGGMAVAAVLGCGIFAGISGSSTSDVLAIGTIMYPALVARGFGPRFSAGLLTSGGSLGIMIPPSIPMLIFAVIAGQSVGRMFLAGAVPGLLIMLVFCIYAIAFAVRHGHRGEAFSWARLAHATLQGAPALLLPVVILGGMYGGLFTATEAAAAAAVYVVGVELLVYRSLGWRDFPRIGLDSAVYVSAILIIIAAASILGQYFTIERVPEALGDLIERYIDSRWTFLLALNLVLLLVGCVLDIISAMILLVPLLLPVAQRFGIDPIHFGVIFVLNLEIGLMTPPVGFNLFVGSLISKLPVPEVARAVVPTALLMLCVLAAVTFVPALSLWLPDLVYGRTR